MLSNETPVRTDRWAAEDAREKPEALAKRMFTAIRAIFT